MSEYTNEVLKVVVSKICLSAGWNSVSSSCLHILIDIFQRYISEIAKFTGRYSTYHGCTEPNINDLETVFKLMSVDLDGLGEYLKTDIPPSPISVPEYPVPKESNLNFLRPGSEEIITRPLYVYSHLPPMSAENAGVTKKIKKVPLQIIELIETPEMEKRENECLWKRITEKFPSRALQNSEISSVLPTPLCTLPEPVEGQLPHSSYPVDTDEVSTSNSKRNRCVIKIPRNVWDKHSISQENSSAPEPAIPQVTSSRKRQLSAFEKEESSTVVDKKKIKILRRIHSRVCKKRIH